MTSGNISSNHPRSGYINDKNYIVVLILCFIDDYVRRSKFSTFQWFTNGRAQTADGTSAAVRIVLLVYTKAFDSFDHRMLFQKIRVSIYDMNYSVE